MQFIFYPWKYFIYLALWNTEACMQLLFFYFYACLKIHFFQKLDLFSFKSCQLKKKAIDSLPSELCQMSNVTANQQKIPQGLPIYDTLFVRVILVLMASHTIL